MEYNEITEAENITIFQQKDICHNDDNETKHQLLCEWEEHIGNNDDNRESGFPIEGKTNIGHKIIVLLEEGIFPEYRCQIPNRKEENNYNKEDILLIAIFESAIHFMDRHTYFIDSNSGEDNSTTPF